MKKRNPYESLAVRFAVKEALRKLHPAFAAGIKFHEAETISGDNGRPELVLHGQALEIQKRYNINSITISLSHSNTSAIAAIIAKKG